jgi:hypothetical protein
MTPAGLEPAIPGSVGRCLIHWATGPLACDCPWRSLAVGVLVRSARVVFFVWFGPFAGNGVRSVAQGCAPRTLWPSG